jgi:hypothetical protein
MLSTSRPGAARAAAKQPVDLDRRHDQRFHTVLRVARVTRTHDAGLWRVRNISDGGIMLMTGVPVAPGEQLEIALSEKIVLAATVLWWDGERCGAEFDQPIDAAAVLEALVEEQHDPHYRPPRLAVSTRALAYCEKGLHTVRIHNLSQRGAGFEHDGCFKEGMTTKLHFADGDEHRGVIRWVKDGQAGIFLYEPFPCAQLESALRM